MGGQPARATLGPAAPMPDLTLTGSRVVPPEVVDPKVLLSVDGTRCLLGRRGCPLTTHWTGGPLWVGRQVRGTVLTFSTTLRLGVVRRGLVGRSGNTQT